MRPLIQPQSARMMMDECQRFRHRFGSGIEPRPSLTIDRCPTGGEDRSVPMRKHQGSCLCGEVRFEITGEFERFFLCHCGRCRKGSGSAHAANLFSSNAKIHWLSGEARIRTFRAPSTRHERSFCSECGSALPSIQMNGALLVVPAGSLDSAIEAQPDAHIFIASRANWDRRLEDVPRIDELPG